MATDLARLRGIGRLSAFRALLITGQRLPYFGGLCCMLGLAATCISILSVETDKSTEAHLSKQC